MIKFKYLLVAIILVNLRDINAQQCRTRKFYNEACNQLNACDPRIKGLVCTGGFCRCESANPFYDLQSKTCLSNCGDGKFTKTDDNTCVSCPTGIFQSNQCLPACPDTFIFDSGKKACVCRSEVPYLDLATNRCVASCSRGTHRNEEQKTCITCLSNQFFSVELRSCVNGCPVGAVNDDNTKECSCQSNTPYLYKPGNKCVQICPFGASIDSLTRTCDCPSTLPYLDVSSFRCIASCPTGLYRNENTRVCNTCPNFFLEPAYSCVDQCDSTTLNVENKRCFCPSNNPFYNFATGVCVQACPSNSVTGSNLNTCSCPTNLPIFNRFSELCVSECPFETIFDDSTKSCYKCTSNAPYFDPVDRLCKATCPLGSVPDALRNKCVRCPVQTPKYMEALGICVQSCLGTTVDTTIPGLCRCPIADNFFVYGQNACVASCNTQFLVDLRYKLCTCPSTNPFWDNLNQVCVITCPYNQFNSYSSRLCVECSSIQFFNEKTETCVSVCPASSIRDDITRRCVTCQEASYYYDRTQSKCISSCPSYLSRDEATKICSCPSTSQYFDPIQIKCLSECPINSFVDNRNKQCLRCSGSRPYLDRASFTCVATCPSTSFQNSLRMICDYCPTNYYYLKPAGICLPFRPTNYDTFNTVDLTCSTSFPYYNIHSQTCVNICSNGLSLDVPTKTCKCFSPNDYYIINSGPLNSTNYCDTDCPLDVTYRDDTLKQCFRCPGSKVVQLFQNRECTDTCSGVTYSNATYGACLCPNNGLSNGIDNCTNTCNEPNRFENKGQCSNCPSTYRFLIEYTGRCVESCPSGMLIENSLRCICPLGTVFDLNTLSCQANCPLNAIQPDDVCKCNINTGYQYFRRDTYSCVNASSCYPLIPDELSNTCIRCPDNAPYLLSHSGECVSACPSGLVLDSNLNRICSCPSGFYQKETKSCVDDCNTGFNIDQTRDYCFCPKYYNFHTGRCVDDLRFCPFGSIIENDSICKCPSSASVFNQYTLECVSQCPDSFSYSSTLRTCSCPSESPIYDRTLNRCVPFCPNNLNFYYNSRLEINECNCPFNAPYFNQATGTCVRKCLSNSYADPQKKYCFTCSENGKYLNKATLTCVSQCPGQTQPNANTKTCECPAGQYFDSISLNCLLACPVNTYPLISSGICVNCKNLIYNRGEGQCVSDCPSGLGLDQTTRTCVCISSGSSLSIYNRDLGDCYSNPLGSVFDPDTNSVKCPDSLPLIEDLFLLPKCVSQCSLGYSLYQRGNVCLFCSNFFNIFTGNCEASCSNMNQNSVTKLCTCPPNNPIYFIDTQTCTNSCSSGNYFDASIKLCTTNQDYSSNNFPPFFG